MLLWFGTAAKQIPIILPTNNFKVSDSPDPGRTASG